MARWQKEQYDHMRENLPLGAVMVHSDFAEKYTCVSKKEVQQDYWNQDSVIMHCQVMSRCASHVNILLFLSSISEHSGKHL
jgi:hypothetical protein